MKKKGLLYTVLATTVAAVLWAVLWPYPHPDSYEIKGFTYLEQPDAITCGPTSVTMVLNHYGKKVTLDDVKKKTKTEWFRWGKDPIGMTSPEFLPRAMKHFGVPAKQIRGNLNRLKYFVSQDRPPIILLRSGATYWHYVVVIGYNEKEIITADPASGKREVMKVEHFMGAWDFVTDMDGKKTVQKCKSCNGTGRWNEWGLGPLSRCEVCDGKGEIPDALALLLKVAEVHPRTMIVPSINTSGSCETNGG